MNEMRCIKILEVGITYLLAQDKFAGFKKSLPALAFVTVNWMLIIMGQRHGGKTTRSFTRPET